MEHGKYHEPGTPVDFGSPLELDAGQRAALATFSEMFGFSLMGTGAWDWTGPESPSNNTVHVEDLDKREGN